MRKFLTIAVALLVTIGVVTGLSQAGSDDDTIKKVMKTAMKGDLCKRVADGKANDDEKKELLSLFESLSKTNPPKGDAESWKTKTTALVNAAQAAVDGKTGAGAQLKKAATCKACHSVHKGQ